MKGNFARLLADLRAKPSTGSVPFVICFCCAKWTQSAECYIEDKTEPGPLPHTAQRVDTQEFLFSHRSPVSLRITFAYNLTPPFRSNDEERSIVKKVTSQAHVS